LKAVTKLLRLASGRLAIVVVGAVFAAGAQRGGAAATLVNHKAPGFVRRDLSGRIVDLARLRGKVVLLNFWATWCAPCEAEIPVFSRWQREYAAQGLQVIGISMDDGEAPVQSFVGRLKPDYPMAMGDAKLGERYGGVLGLPLTYLIDRKGVVRAQFQGSADLKPVERRIRELLGER
jgi:cytochrome c biogenesis protein CcmG/thiol:disulfide interchange protein DsbE